MKIELKPIEEHSYEYGDGFNGTMASIPDYPDGERMIDWHTVMGLIDSKEHSVIEVGLAEDWACSMARVYDADADGVMWHENELAGFYGCSRWATPAIKLDGELFECWVFGGNPYRSIEFKKRLRDKK